jgi:hypothetical protein
MGKNRLIITYSLENQRKNSQSPEAKVSWQELQGQLDVKKGWNHCQATPETAEERERERCYLLPSAHPPISHQHPQLIKATQKPPFQRAVPLWDCTEQGKHKKSVRNNVGVLYIFPWKLHPSNSSISNAFCIYI